MLTAHARQQDQSSDIANLDEETQHQAFICHEWTRSRGEMERGWISSCTGKSKARRGGDKVGYLDDNNNNANPLYCIQATNYCFLFSLPLFSPTTYYIFSWK